ncbi:MAG: glycosyltransferase family 4 protein [Pseudomonas kermanshahensis]|uniref:glycosyltransferase family 4 protein n=1 Tax=Pseudomonas kermanshahensis TaxID=2745482 RepID=UPI0020935873|nr:glycosyltransferase family 4 protein [Pseudomonas kermanshahensis]USS57305.1 glycosyltransferase family 4 protein [Pseudomonas kermanshahensis]
MNIVMLCTKFSRQESDPWLTNEMAAALRGQGHSVTVINLDWWAQAGDPDRRFVTSTGVEVTSLVPLHVSSRLPLVRRLAKWVGSSFRVIKLLRETARSRHIDLLIGFSPAVTMALPLLWQRFIGRARSYMVLWDFFPYHQQQVGLMPSGIVFRLAKWLESTLIRSFDHVGCMSPANVAYLKRHYPLRASQGIHILPIWGGNAPIVAVDRSRVRQAAGLPLDRQIVVFGGQLVHGRGLEDLLEVARIAARGGSRSHYLIMGSGTLEGLVQAYLGEGHGNLTWIARVPRDQYLEIAQSCDAALVCTVRDVDVPSFPSKTIDYLRLGLPIVASVERSTDYGEFIVQQGVGVCVEAGEPVQLHVCIEQLLADDERLAEMARRGPACMAEHFDVEQVARLLLSQAGHSEH